MVVDEIGSFYEEFGFNTICKITQELQELMYRLIQLCL